MFERRLKILLGVLVAVATVLGVRAAQVQVWDRAYWQERAVATMTDSQLVETTRGRILDYRGREVAVDVGCIDVCVDYRAITPEPQGKWVRDLAASRLQASLGTTWRKADEKQRALFLADEIELVKRDIEGMWATLGKKELTGKTREEIEEIRRSIVQRVEMRRRYLWYRNYGKAMKEHKSREPLPWWKRWLVDESHDVPQMDQFDLTVAEQRDAHVILSAISTELSNDLEKNVGKYPGLVLRLSRHRVYPYKEVACHVLGNLSAVNKEDLDNDPSGGDELRRYWPNDLIGRSGLEAYCEPILRGSRGRVAKIVGENKTIESIDSVPGQDVRMTIDMELQREIEKQFAHPQLADGNLDSYPLYGAAVVIDVPTGEVRALVSYPTYDVNELQEKYSELVKDEINRPLLNRATQAQLEPGSTVKPVVGLGAITAGVVKPYEGIECTGFLVIGGKKYDVGKCWVATRFMHVIPSVAHHPIPIPHVGTHGNPDGFLIYPEALERSCNVYFETVADRLGLDGLSYWYDRVGLGRPTGVGIAEASGRLPNSFKGPDHEKRMTTWFAGIGQGQVAATPIQMANVAAMIARDGVWMKPRLVEGASPERVNLQFSPLAVALAKEGMIAVVNGAAGTGKVLHRDDMVVAGKTGTAQAARFSIPLRDEKGEIVKVNGQEQRQFLEMSTSQHVNPMAPWYRGTGKDEQQLAHAWFIGFAPAQKPQVAFAVMVEYGGSGGISAGNIAKAVLEACMEHGYLAGEGGTGIQSHE